MTYDPKRPARERTPFGNFELRRSHLITGKIQVPYAPALSITTTSHRAAALAICERATNAADARAMLQMLGFEDV